MCISCITILTVLTAILIIGRIVIRWFYYKYNSESSKNYEKIDRLSPWWNWTMVGYFVLAILWIIVVIIRIHDDRYNKIDHYVEESVVVDTFYIRSPNISNSLTGTFRVHGTKLENNKLYTYFLALDPSTFIYEELPVDSTIICVETGIIPFVEHRYYTTGVIKRSVFMSFITGKPKRQFVTRLRDRKESVIHINEEEQVEPATSTPVK